jgi:hypothetical protein
MAPPLNLGGPKPSPTLLRRAWRLIRIVFAFTIIILAAGLGLVPGIPGWPLAFFGLGILAAEFVWANRLLKRIKTGTRKLKDAALLRRRKNGAPRPKA